MTEYSNPRMSAVIDDWPSGTKRVSAKFEIEQHPTRGERGVRTTTGSPKKLTYVHKARIVDGDDGRTYIAEYSPAHHLITIMRGDFKHQHEEVFEDNPRFAKLLALFFWGRLIMGQSSQNR
jgi:hypothetical protein